MTNTPETATSQETRAELLRAQARGYTQVRHVFVQKQDGDGGTGSRASTLAAFVHARRHRALQLYLLLLGARHLIKVREERNQPPLEAGVWVRALTSADSTAPTWSKSTLSRTWAELEEMGLVHRDRRNRLVFIEPRREDGEADYESAGGRRDHINWYFTLPDEFWTDSWFGKLSLAALAVLLVVAKETNDTDEIRLTYQQFEDWYGIGRRTAVKGMRELVGHGLVQVRQESVKAALSGTGRTVHQHFSLTGAFSYQSRNARQNKAAMEAAGRAAATKPAKVSAPAKSIKKPRKRKASDE